MVQKEEKNRIEGEMQLPTLEAVSREIYLAQGWRNLLGQNSCTFY